MMISAQFAHRTHHVRHASLDMLSIINHNVSEAAGQASLDWLVAALASYVALLLPIVRVVLLIPMMPLQSYAANAHLDISSAMVLV